MSNLENNINATGKRNMRISLENQCHLSLLAKEQKDERRKFYAGKL